MAKYDTVAEGFAAAKVDGARHHLFLCLGPDCAPLPEGEKTWNHLKQRCAELKLPVMRTKAGCLKVCAGGPWLLVYPEGVWYGEVDAGALRTHFAGACGAGKADRRMGGEDASALRNLGGSFWTGLPGWR